jgi:hypothetical protein
MKQIFVLTRPEQRLIIVLILLLVAGAWYKHHRDLENTLRPQPTPQGTTLSAPATN